MGKSVNIARKLSAKSTVIINAASDGIFYHGLGMGSGVSLGRLMRNVPAWLADPRSQWALLRGMAQASRRPVLAARLCYFSLNHLSYEAFEHQERDTGAADDDVSCPGEEDADPLVFSKQFPMRGFRRKYPRGRLFREWDSIRTLLERRRVQGQVLVFPCAPLQLVEIN
jgi:hypothetical protein